MTTTRSAFNHGDRTNTHAALMVKTKHNPDPVGFLRKPQRAVQSVADHSITTVVTAGLNIGGKAIVENDENTVQPTKTKRVDVFEASGWDDVASDFNNRKTGFDDRRASIVSPAHSEENFEDEEFNGVLKDLSGKHGISFDTSVQTSIITSETDDHAKAVANGYVFSEAFVEKAAREVLRPLEGESVEDAIENMKEICLKAMKNAGEDWKSIVEDNDKYNILLSNTIKSKVIYKTLFVLGVLDVVGDTVSMNLPPTTMKSCELARLKAMKWIGQNKKGDLWTPKTSTVYKWYRDFTNGRFFRHPERAHHTTMQLFERLEKYFSENPTKQRAFKAHVQSVLKQQRVFIQNGSDGNAHCSMVRDGTLIGNAYDFYCYFVNDILRESSDKAPVTKRDANERKEQSSAKDYAEFLAKKQDHLTSFGFQNLTWQHLSAWMERNWTKTRHFADPL